MSNLWEPPNIHALPTPSETKLAKESIKSLELQLQSALAALLQAQHAVKTIQQKIEDRRAWIAPIRRISHDVLSLIFLEVCQIKWSAPLILGQVCQVWRESIIAYPRAWSYFQLQEGQSNELQSLFISRSAPCSLHLRLPSQSDSRAFELLFSVTGRIQCLSLDMNQVRNLQGHRFPAIERLNIDSCEDIYSPGQDPGFILNHALFPRLRSLNALTLLERIPWVRRDTPPFPNVVPLQVLSLEVDNKSVWRNIVECCSQTLTSLAVILRPTGREVPRKTISLSRLEALHITNNSWTRPAEWSIDARTPALQTYFEYSTEDNFVGPIHEDTQNVTSLYFGRDIDLSKFPQVRQMTVLNPRTRYRGVQQLVKASTICPNLDTIVDDWSSPEDLLSAQTLIAARNKQTGGKIQFRRSHDNGVVLYQHPEDLKCGYNRPCAHRP